MSTTTDVRNKVVAIIKSVPDSGVVYPHYKYASDYAKFLDQFRVNLGGFPHIRGWWISPPTLPGSTAGDSFDSSWDTFIYVIRGTMTYKDSLNTEEVFSDLAFSVRDTLHHQGTLGLDDVIPGSIDATLPIFDLRQFSSYLCHYVEIRFSVGINNVNEWVA